MTFEPLTLRDELDGLRSQANALWGPFRWLLHRKLDKLEAILDKNRDIAIRRHFQS